MESIKKASAALDVKYVFTKDIFSTIQVEEGLLRMDTILTVNDLVHLQKYIVRGAGYTKDTLIIPGAAARDNIEIISERELDEKLFGLSQVEYSCLTSTQDTIVVVTTEDLLLPSVAPQAPFNLPFTGTLLSMQMNSGVATVKYEMTSFVAEVLDEKYISTDFSQLQNLTEAVTPLSGGDTEVEDTEVVDYVAELEKEYGEYEPQGTNSDILIQIAKEGYFSEESIEDILEKKIDIDVPGILERLGYGSGSEIDYFAEKKPESIRSDFKRWGIISPSISLVLSDTSYWSTIYNNDKSAVLAFANMHDALMTETARQQIVDNAVSIRFISDIDESINKEFIKGELGIDEWYGQFDSHIPLKMGKAKDVDEIYHIIQYMFDEAFKGQPLDFAIGFTDDEFVIESNNAKHMLSIEGFYEEDYDGEYNEKEDRYEYKEEIEFNSTFYWKIVDKIKQVAADNGLPQGYSVFTTRPVGPMGFDEYVYQGLIDKFSSLDHYEERLYLKKMIKKVYDPFARLNMSFPYHPDVGIGTHTSFGPDHLINVKFDIQYVTTANKLEFIQFMKQNTTVYNLDILAIKEDSVTIMNTLMEGSIDLIRYLGPVKVTVGKNHFKSMYDKEFTEKRNTMSTAYYNIDKVLNDDLTMSQFRYDQEAYREYFMFEGKECSIEPGGNNMMKFIGKHIHMSKSGKKFFREDTWSVMEEVYYYLLPEHAKMLKDMLDLPISI